MDINNQFNQELLSAYLDDALTAEELGLVENWLANEPAAVTYLNEIRSNRKSLKALAGLPAAGLGSSFADRVMAQAIEVGSHPSQVVRVPETLPSPSTKRWWAWGAVAATAAAVGWLAIVPMVHTPDMQPLVNGSTENLTIQSPAVSEPEQPGFEEMEKPDGVKPDGANSSGNTLVGKGNSAPDKLHSSDSFAPLQLIFIGDAVMSKSAWESGRFDQLLEEYGIRYEKELIASREMIEGLIESQTIVGPDADPNSRQEAALIYVDCPVVALSKLLVKLENERNDFLNFNVTMAMNGGGLGLPNSYDKLLNALQKESSPSNGRGIARLILPDSSSPALGKLLPGFEVVEKTIKPGGGELAALVAADAQMKGNKPAVNENGQMLLILRKQ